VTAREHRLRRRIDQLRDERDLLRDLTGRAHAALFRHCIYCGSYTWGRACPRHRDLLALDPEITA
jgi:hypothetical protein